MRWGRSQSRLHQVFLQNFVKKKLAKTHPPTPPPTPSNRIKDSTVAPAHLDGTLPGDFGFDPLGRMGPAQAANPVGTP